MDKRREIMYDGEIILENTVIPCYILDDGTRVLSGNGMEKVLKMMDEDATQGSYRLNRYLTQKTLQPFILSGKSSNHFEPLECYLGERKINGYEANILIDICEAFLEARRNVNLSSRQKIIAEQCEILIQGFARVGLTALIDEATGYQYERENDELQKILSRYISSRLLPWQKKFLDVFYTELFRLNGWDYTVKGIKKRPGVIGTWTNKLVYEQLPDGVLEELKKRTPKNIKGKNIARLHQLLTEDIGSPDLVAQINQVITLFQLSDNMEHMWKQFERLQARKMGQISIEEAFPISFNDKGHSIFEEKKEEPLSDYNVKLKKALRYKEAPVE